MMLYLLTSPASCAICRATRLARAVGLIFVICAALSVSAASQGATFVPGSTAAVPVQFFYVPWPENQLLQALQAIESGGPGVTPVSPVTTYLSLAAVADGTVIYYDQWENGYDPDIADPGNLYSSTNLGGTQIWGDGNIDNGAPPGIATDIINPGTVIVLKNPVDTSTRQAVIDFDGGDKIAATRDIAMTRTGWAAGPNTLLSGSVEVFDTRSWGTDYRAPVGQNIVDTVDYQMFEYTGLAIMAGPGGANVQIDANRDGAFETSATLAEGESRLVNGGVNVGGRVLSDRPIQVDILTGDRGSAYESRDSALLPVTAWSSSYYTPVSTATYGTTVWLYNPGTSSISVTYQRRLTTGLTTSTITVPAGGSAKQVLLSAVGARFFTSGAPFYAFSTTDSTSSTYAYNQAWDWGFTLVPQNALTPQVLVGLGIGRDPTSTVSPTENGNPLWVTPVGNGNTYVPVYVDYDADPSTGALTDPNGSRYDTSYNLRELDQARIYDPNDRNQTGMLAYVLASGVKLAAAWGQDPSKASDGAPGLDVGTGAPPLPLFSAGKKGTLYTDNDEDGYVSPGDELLYTVVIHNIARVPVPGLLLKDLLPADVTYVPGTTYNGAVQVSDDASPATPFPLDEGGAAIGTLPVGASFVVTFRVIVDSFANLTPGLEELLNTGSASAAGNTVTFSDVTPLYGRLGDRAWDDANANGLQDTGEKGLPGMTVRLLAAGGSLLADTATDEAGIYAFTGLSAGGYFVEFVAPAGYNPSPRDQGADDAVDSDADPASGRTSLITLAAGEPRITVDAGFWQPAPRIDIQKTPDTQTVLPGGTASFAIQVTNTGNAPLTDVEVTDALAPGCARKIGALAVGAGSSYACTLEKVTSGFTNVAVVSGVHAGVTVTDQDDAVVVLDILPDIAVEKSADPTSVPETGGPVRFTYAVTNRSAEDATIQALSDDKFGALAGDADCRVGTVLPAAGACSFAATFAVPPGDVPGDHTDIFTATAVDPEGHTDTANDDATVTYTDVPPDIMVIKTADNAPASVPETGGLVKFTFSVINQGPEPVAITALSDDKFGTLAGDADCQVGTVLAAKGGSCSFDATFAIPPGDFPAAHVNTFTATAVDDDGSLDTATDDESVAYLDVLPDIDITKTVNPTSVPETGGSVTFTIVVTNNGAEPVRIDSLADDHFPLAVHCQAAVGTTLVQGQTYTCTFSAIVSGDYESAAPHVNTATVVGVDDDGNSDTDSDDATVTFTNVSPLIDVEKYVSIDDGLTWQDADLAPGPFLNAGTDPRFKFVVTNIGSPALSDLHLADAGFAAFFAENLVSACLLPTELAPGAAFTCFARGAWGVGQHTNTAIASGSFTDGAGNSERDDDSDDANYMGAGIDFSVTKICAAGATPVPQEGPAPFTVTFINNGNVPLSISADDGIGTFDLAAGSTRTFDVQAGGPFTGQAVAANTVTASGSYRDDAGHQRAIDRSGSGTCRVASRVNLLKLTQGTVDPSKTWTFSLWAGAHGFGGTRLAGAGTSADADGVLVFENVNLDRNKAYTVCEEKVPSAWTPSWLVDANHDGTAEQAVTPYNPDATQDPPQDVGHRCVDFGGETGLDLLTDGGVLFFQVDNHYPGGEPRTPGYWKNWNRCTGGEQADVADRNGGWRAGYWLVEDVLDPAIGGGITWDDIAADVFVFPITTCAVAVDLLDHRDIADPAVVGDGIPRVNDAAYTLAMHLLAAQLNFGAHARSCDAAMDAALAGEQLLDNYDFDGTGDYLLGSDKTRRADYDLALELASTLDRYNNGALCTGPVVSFVNPTDGATVAGDQVVRVNVEDEAAVSRVEFFVDGLSIGVDATPSDGWLTLWQSASVADGIHVLSAKATNGLGQSGSADIGVVVENIVEPPPSPIAVLSLEGQSSWLNPAKWEASVLVTVTPPLAGAVVTGSWSDGMPASCTTGTGGACSIVLPDISKKTTAVQLEVTGIALTGYVFQATGPGSITVSAP